MFYNDLIERVCLPIGDQILGTSFIEGLNHWRKQQYLDEEKLRESQFNSLCKLLEHATSKIKYYKQLNCQQKQDPQEWLKQFPILTKPIIKENLENMLLITDTSGLVKESSSGSSGIQGVVYLSPKESSYTQGVQILFWEWAGYRLGDSVLQLGISPERTTVKRVKDIILRTTYTNAYNIDKDIVLNILRSKKQPQFFCGYASGLYTYAEIAREHGINNIKFNAVISFGDKLFPHYRNTIEEVFHAKTYDTYGCTEGIIISGECEYGNQHVFTPHVYLELLDKNGKEVNPGELGYVVVTRLDGYTMPLIRYYLGDLAIKKADNSQCSCGRKLPILEKIVGRDTDIIVTPSGKRLIVHFFTGICEHIGQIKQFRVIQHSLEDIEMEIIPGMQFDAEVVINLRNKIYERATEIFPIRFSMVENIPSTSSGKPQIILSKLPKGIQN